MRVFLTGASGYIGSVVAAELIRGGHDVVGLARSEQSAARVEAVGATPLRGTLDDTDLLAEAARAADGVIHTAFKLDAGLDTPEAISTDRRVIATFGEALSGSDKPLVVTSPTLLSARPVGRPRPLTEESRVSRLRAWLIKRSASEPDALRWARRGVRAVIVRLAPLVHGPGDTRGFIPTLVQSARAAGRSIYANAGRNRWPAVHNLDAARLFRIALESAPAGSVVHGVGDGGIALHEIATAVGRSLGLPVASVPAREARERIPRLARFLTLDHPVSSARTQKLLGWKPNHPGLLDDIARGTYRDV